MTKKIMIFGTNTGVGKTYFSGLLCKQLKEKCYSVCYLKPVQTGYPENDDASTVRKIAGLTQQEAFAFVKAKQPVAPAALFDEFDITDLIDLISGLSNYDFLIIETAGGVCSPLDKKHLNYQLAKILGVDLSIVVVLNRLGCINDALLVDYLFRHENIEYVFAMNEFLREFDLQKNWELIKLFSRKSIGFDFKDEINFRIQLIDK